jgi:dipeptidyl aminopeptidase/acylaminoacyl peptidase
MLAPDEYLDALLSLPGMSLPVVSRDGRWVAWTWFRTGPAADVFAAPMDGSQPPVRLTGTGDDTFIIGWTPDSRAVLVAQDRDGNERSTIYRVDRDRPLTMVPLTDEDPHYFIRGGSLHPNGRWLVYGANYDFEAGQEIAPTWVVRHNLLTGERVVLARPERPAYAVPDLSPTGGHVLYTRADRHPAGRQLWLVGIDGADDREIFSAGDAVKAFGGWFPDGQRVLIMAETQTHRRIGVWALADGSLRWLLDDPARDIQMAHVPFGSRHIVLVETHHARTRSSLLDPDTGAETHLPDVPGNLRLLAPVGGDEWAAVVFSSRQPADVVRLRLDDPCPERSVSLSRVWERTALTPADLTPALPFEWQSVDGLPIHGWLYGPAGEPVGTIVYVHGGPSAHSADAINNQIQYFVRQGFAVLDPNYRGSTGYGLPFRLKIREDGWGGREQDDIRTGIAALVAAGIAQPGRVGITGTSYGGYSSWCCITRLPYDLLAAAVPVCGMTDLVVDYHTTRPDLRPLSEEMLGGSPEQVPDRYFERSPVNFLHNISGHVMIVQGMQDPNVTPENVRVVKERLDAAGVEYQLLAFEDEGHGISRPANQKTLFVHMAAFFAGAFEAGEQSR